MGESEALDGGGRRSGGIMKIQLHPHAIERANERGATKDEVEDTVLHGEEFPVKHSRTGFRKTTIFNDTWQGEKFYAKQIECYAVKENDIWLVISVIVRYF